MITPYIIALFIAGSTLLRAQQIKKNRAQIEHHYLQMLLLADSQSERYIEEISRLAGNRTKRAAAEVIAELSPIIYRLDPQWLESTSRSLHLTEFLLHQTRKSRGFERALYLSIFSKIPLTPFDLKLLEPYYQSKNRMVQFYALMATINADRNNTLLHIAAYPNTLTPFETQQLLSMLRQGSMAVAHQPMLAAKNVNLNLLGLALVHHFAIESAEPELREIISSSDNYTLRREALYALSSMQMLLCTPSINHFVRNMPHIDNHRFIRHIASEGYSQSVVCFFLRQDEKQYFDSLINSYKIKIGCL